MLNYGHTFAHALESASGYGTFLHGEAVSVGMHLAALCAQRLGRVDSEFVERQRTLLENLQLPIHFKGLDPEQLWELMQHDKKVQHGTLRFILPDRLGHVELVADVPRQLVLEVLAEGAR
ncbi:MAG: 3-dehydroquinate synthase family protein [Aureliella sp.]